MAGNIRSGESGHTIVGLVLTTVTVGVALVVTAPMLSGLGWGDPTPSPSTSSGPPSPAAAVSTPGSEVEPSKTGAPGPQGGPAATPSPSVSADSRPAVNEIRRALLSARGAQRAIHASNGRFSPSGTDLWTHGYGGDQYPDVVVFIVTSTNNDLCLSARHALLPGVELFLTDETPVPVEESCA